MRRALKRVPANRPPSVVVPLGLPVQGWNVRDQLADIGPTYAPRLDNLYPEDGALVLREGYASHATGIGGAVETLMEYRAGAATKRFACGNGGIYEITAAGAVGSAAVGTLTNNRWDWVNFSTLGDDPTLVCVNGADGWYTFDGTTWTEETITTADAATLIGIAAHKSTLWTIEESTLIAWFTNVPLAISGAMVAFPVGGLCSRGGALAALATWTRDGGAGPDDFLVMITTEGEVLVYAGTDPSTDFQLVGRYTIPRPLGGTRCAAEIGGTLMILTESGVVSMNDVAAGSTARISGPIDSAFETKARANPTSARWQIISHASANRLIVNVPHLTGATYQYVYSADTGAWSRTTGREASCWLDASAALYFGDANGVVFTADSGRSDNGAAILWDVVLAPQRFASSEVHFRRARLQARVTGGFAPMIEMVPDYVVPTAGSGAAAVIVPAGPEWGVAEWGVAEWAQTNKPVSVVVGLRGRGYVGSVRLSGASVGSVVRIDSVTITADAGRTL